MTWEEYYEEFYDWAESTQIKKLSSVEDALTRPRRMIKGRIIETCED